MDLDKSNQFQGTCMCASSGETGFPKGKVLYCFGEVKQMLRGAKQDQQDCDSRTYRRKEPVWEYSLKI